jgi:hypothetical protein
MVTPLLEGNKMSFYFRFTVDGDKISRYFIVFYLFQVIMEAVNKPRNIHYKGVADLVTE